MVLVDALVILIAVVVLPIAVLASRRMLLGRGGGTVELSMRLTTRSYARGWVLGVGRYAGDELQFYRVFSLALRPRRALDRHSLRIRRRRVPRGREAFSLQADSVVLECESGADHVQLAMSEPALTGFLSWLEAEPPGSSYRR